MAMQVSTHKKIKIPAAITSEKAREYLFSKGRNSPQTAGTYGTGIVSMQRFLVATYPQYQKEDTEILDNVLQAAKEGELDVYRIFDKFVAYLLDRGIDASSIHPWVKGVKGLFIYHDVDIVPNKFRSKVTLPAVRKEDEFPLTLQTIRTILSTVTHPRYKTYYIALACLGCRAVEGLAIRARDINFDTQPTSVYMRAEYSKNKLPRTIYLTNEGTQWFKLLWKKRFKDEPDPDELLFSVYPNAAPESMYVEMRNHFASLIDSLGYGKRKPGKAKRHLITLHSFRRWVETTIEDHTSANFADYFLGHKKSVYYVKSEEERRELYAEKCIEHLTYLDLNAMQAKVAEKDRRLREKDAELERADARVTDLERRLRAKGIL